MNIYINPKGQTTVEYMLVLAFVITFSISVLTLFRNSFNGTFQGLGHLLSGYLSSGVCQSECFMPGYFNGFQQ